MKTRQLTERPLRYWTRPNGSDTPPPNICNKDIRAIARTLHGISIEGALEILRVFKYGNEVVYQNNQKWRASDLSDDAYFPDLQGRTAKETGPLLFWGGPPAKGKLAWYHGTLLTLVKDRVLAEILKRGVKEVAMWIGTDAGEIK